MSGPYDIFGRGLRLWRPVLTFLACPPSPWWLLGYQAIIFAIMIGLMYGGVI